MQLDALRFRPEIQTRSGYPFELELIRKTEELRFTSAVTFFVGENGSGKSTVLEAIATGAKLATVGRQDASRDPELEAARALSKEMQLVWSKRTHRGFFMRSADFFSFRRVINQQKEELQEMADEFDQKLTGHGRALAMGTVLGQKAALEARYEGDPTARSHGEGFLQLFRSRFVPEGLYLLDEPEVALSPQSQLGMISLMKEMVGQGGQFIVATHSSILMAFPDAVILDFDQVPPAPIAYDDVGHVRMMRDFLKLPAVFLRHL